KWSSPRSESRAAACWRSAAGYPKRYFGAGPERPAERPAGPEVWALVAGGAGVLVLGAAVVVWRGGRPR
ncbi:hypothetical protein ACWGIG_38435, partial [Streptomyces sp. NPDC054863]